MDSYILILPFLWAVLTMYLKLKSLMESMGGRDASEEFPTMPRKENYYENFHDGAGHHDHSHGHGDYHGLGTMPLPVANVHQRNA